MTRERKVSGLALRAIRSPLCNAFEAIASSPLFLGALQPPHRSEGASFRDRASHSPRLFPRPAIRFTFPSYTLPLCLCLDLSKTFSLSLPLSTLSLDLL